jgi:hypothetical protein
LTSPEDKKLKERVLIPESQEAPVAMIPRWKQPVSGIVSLILVFAITFLVWFIPGVATLSSILAGFGIMGVLFAIWGENWPISKLREPWKIGLVATIVNIVITFVFFFVANWFAMVYSPWIGVTDPAAHIGVGWAIFGSLSASMFSFAVLWLAGSMYWPWFDKKQPARGIRLFIVGWIITIIVWLILFFPYGNPDAVPTDVQSWVLPQYGISMGWTQWTIFFSLLTLMAFEYWPWDKAGKQPKIGVAALIGCSILGLIMVVAAGFIVGFIFVPVFALLGYTVPGTEQLLVGIGLMNVGYADWLIVAVVVVSLFFDNWPKKYSQGKNLAVRFITILVIGTVLFATFYLYSPFLGAAYVGSPFYDNPTSFLLMLIWVQLIFAYLWKKWPVAEAL